jgi:hypothetical protein
MGHQWKIKGHIEMLLQKYKWNSKQFGRAHEDSDIYIWVRWKCHTPNLIFIENSQNVRKSLSLEYNKWQES